MYILRAIIKKPANKLLMETYITYTFVAPGYKLKILLVPFMSSKVIK